MPMTAVPLVDLRAQHEEIAAEVEEGVARVMRDCCFILGPDVAAFEKEFAAFSGARHCIGVGNGTDALELMLRAAGVGEGDEVILPANTFVATALAVVRAGAKPVLADCDPKYMLMDPGATKARITKNTRALLPVHLYGQMAAMEEFESLAEKHGLVLLEDAAQSQGAARHESQCGAFGLAAGVSFYPGKNIGAYGDAGAIITNSDDIADQVRKLRNWGSDRKYYHPEIGFNSRLDTMQAVVLRAKLKRLAEWNEKRRLAAARYDRMLEGMQGVVGPATLPGNRHVWHLYVVRVPQRDRVLARLNEAGIGAGIHYPTPVHLHGAFAHLGYGEGDFPVAEAAAKEILSLPLYPHLTEEQQEQVVEVLKGALDSL